MKTMNFFITCAFAAAAAVLAATVLPTAAHAGGAKPAPIPKKYHGDWCWPGGTGKHVTLVRRNRSGDCPDHLFPLVITATGYGIEDEECEATSVSSRTIDFKCVHIDSVPEQRWNERWNIRMVGNKIIARIR
jgi:hypothetical protein